MGMWDETCAITHFPIFPNDPCVVVVFDAKAVGGERASLGADALQHVRAIHRGAYNAYGWIDDVSEEGVDGDRDVLVFVHRDAWDEVVAAWGGQVRPRGDLPPPGASVTAEDLPELQVGLGVAGRTPRDLLG